MKWRLPPLGNCDIFMKQKILVINETKWDEILLKWMLVTQETFTENHKRLLKL